MSESEADLEALLAFLDASEAPTTLSEGSSGSQDGCRALLLSAETGNVSVSSGAKKKRKNPNHARSELHKELMRLRTEAQKLQGTLRALELAQQQITGGGGTSTALSMGKVGNRGRAKEMAVWREIAARQMAHVTAGQDENKALKIMIQMQEKQIEALQGLVFSKVNAKVGRLQGENPVGVELNAKRSFCGDI